MLQGSFKHEDFCGHKGTINPGDLQVIIIVPTQVTFNEGVCLTVDDSWTWHCSF